MARAVFSSVCLIVSLLAVRSDTTNAPIVVGSFDDTFHQAESACVANVLQQRGYNATLLVGNQTKINSNKINSIFYLSALEQAVMQKGRSCS